MNKTVFSSLEQLGKKRGTHTKRIKDLLPVTLLSALLALSFHSAQAQAAPSKTARFHPGHYVLVAGRDPSDEEIDKALRFSPKFRGIQVMYSWKNLEPSPGHYDCSMISRHLRMAKLLNKHLIVQVQVKGFNPNPYTVCPTWLKGSAKPGGGNYNAFYVAKFGANGAPRVVQPVFWDPMVNYRIVCLIRHLGATLSSDPSAQALEIVNMPETAPGKLENISTQKDVYPLPSKDQFVELIAARFGQLNSALPHTIAMQYINFFFGKERDLLDREIAEGVGVGSPDLAPDLSDNVFKIVYPLFLAAHGKVPTLSSVQYADTFDNETDEDGKVRRVPNDRSDVIKTFNLARSLKLNYVTWMAKSDYLPLVKSVLEDPDIVSPSDPAGGLSSRYPLAIKPLLR